MSPDDLRIPLRDYLDDKFSEQRDWMAATFATKDDLAVIRQDVAVLNARDVNSSRKAAGAWGAAGTFVGGAILSVLAYFGVGPGAR